MKKRKMLTIVMVFCVVVFSMTSANADYLPNDSNIMSTIETYLGSSTYFHGYKPVTPDGDLTFRGNWQYTAIAFEAGNANITENAVAGPATFDTEATGNWGTWVNVNFTTGNIYFSDLTNGPYNIPFNPFTPPYLKLFQLDNASEALNYLPGNRGLVLAAGTYIIGWNDNLESQSNDSDYDDIIIALRPAPVPEPTSMLLLGLGLAGLVGVSRRFRK